VDNTLEAMLKAVRAGIRFIETDVRCTSGGELVLCHDPIIWAKVASRLTYEELEKTAPDRPRLSEVLDRLAAWVRLNLEIKNAPPDPVSAIVNIYRIDTTTLVSSFNMKFIEALQVPLPAGENRVSLQEPLRGRKEAQESLGVWS